MLHPKFIRITVDRFAPLWESANGSAIWASPNSDENEIAGNTFEDIAGIAVVVEGASNHVALRSADDTVRDMGPDNRVTQQPERP